MDATLSADNPPVPGRYYLGYLAQPWTCESYDPDTGVAMMRGGQPEHPIGPAQAFTATEWHGLVTPRPRDVMRTIDLREGCSREDKRPVSASQAQLRELLLWHSVVKVADDTLALDNGVQLRVVPNSGCGGCELGNYVLAELNDSPNAITAVDFEDVDGETYRIFVIAEDRRLKLAEVTGSDNGYYGTGYWVEVTNA